MAYIRATALCIDIPIYDIAGSSLRRLVLGRTVGGRFARSGMHVVVNALKNITFEIADGDRVGLIGTNGSGKTTLLRLLAQVYQPSGGSLEISGRISPLLDPLLGMSLDATGYENIWICGTLWGLSKHQIKLAVDDVAEFTELGDFLTVPVRTYSTGMQMRLAFAIATLQEPDILLIDEVIGTGDAGFFDKAFVRLRQLVRRSSILVVASHSHSMLAQICNKAIWLHKGDMLRCGEFCDVAAAYEKATAERREQ